MKVGDVVVQRATYHNWVNRGTEPCMVVFILIATEEGHRPAGNGFSCLRDRHGPLSWLFVSIRYEREEILRISSRLYRQTSELLTGLYIFQSDERPWQASGQGRAMLTRSGARGLSSGDEGSPGF